MDYHCHRRYEAILSHLYNCRRVKQGRERARVNREYCVRLIFTWLGPTTESDLTRALIGGAQPYSWLVAPRRAVL